MLFTLSITIIYIYFIRNQKFKYFHKIPKILRRVGVRPRLRLQTNKYTLLKNKNLTNNTVTQGWFSVEGLHRKPTSTLYLRNKFYK